MTEKKLTTLTHLEAAAREAEKLSFTVAAAAAAAIEELSGKIVSMDQINMAINAAVTGAIEEAY